MLKGIYTPVLGPKTKKVVGVVRTHNGLVARLFSGVEDNRDVLSEIGHNRMIQTNADEVADTIPKRFKNLREEFEEERDRALSDAKELARSRVPVDKGDLRTDISIDLRADKLYNTLDYAPRINWGFTGRDTLGRYYDQEGTYYLEDSALDAFIESVERLRR